jgi:hypothetical protein
MKKLMLIVAILFMASNGWCFPPTPPGGGAAFSVTDITGQTDDTTPATTATAVLAQGGSLIESTLAQIGVTLGVIDWTADQGATNIHAGNIPDLSGTYQPTGSYQTSDADLTAIAALSCSENQIIKRNGAGAWVCAADADAGGDVTGVLDDTGGDVPMLYQAATAFTINDETPSVSGKSAWKTANAATPTTITQFDGLTAGQMFWVLIDDVSTTVDFSQANLSGNGELSYTASSGDLLFCFSPDGTLARCQLIGGGVWGVSGTITDEQLIAAETSGGKLLLKSAGLKTTGFDTLAVGDVPVKTGTSTMGPQPRTVIVLVPSGTHDGGDDQAIMTDGGIDIGADALIGMTVYNVTDGSSCTITDNAATTITCTLAGGTGNDWDDGDVWRVGPGPTQSDATFYCGAGNLMWPATVGYRAVIFAEATSALKIYPASASMVFTGTLNTAVESTTAGDYIAASGSTTDDFMALMNKSATVVKGVGKRGTWTQE